MAVSDYVVVAAPLTDDTRGLIGEKELARDEAMRVIINVGRGPVISEATLIRVLRKSGSGGGAGRIRYRSRCRKDIPSGKCRTCCSRRTALTTPPLGWRRRWSCLSPISSDFIKGEPLRERGGQARGLLNGDVDIFRRRPPALSRLRTAHR